MVTTISIPRTTASKILLKKALLACGLISSLYYIAINILVPLFYPGYSHITYTISELSAIGSPTRQLWLWLGPFYILFFAAFGWGILKVARDNHPLRIAGILILVYSIINFYWPPMHVRGTETTMSDTLHLVWGGIASIGMIMMMGFSAAAFGKKFRIYSITTIVLLLVFGFLMSLEAPNIPTNEPTPLIGFWERLMLGVFLLYISALSVKLINRESLPSGK